MSFDYEAHRKKQRQELDKKRRDAADKKKRERKEKEQKAKKAAKWEERKKQMREETEQKAGEMSGSGTSAIPGLEQPQQNGKPQEAPRINRGFGLGAGGGNRASKSKSKSRPGSKRSAPGQKDAGGQSLRGAAGGGVPKLRRPF